MEVLLQEVKHLGIYVTFFLCKKLPKSTKEID